MRTQDKFRSLSTAPNISIDFSDLEALAKKTVAWIHWALIFWILGSPSRQQFETHDDVVMNALWDSVRGLNFGQRQIGKVGKEVPSGYS